MQDLHLEPTLQLLLLACLVGMAMQWIKRPYTIALVVMGLVIALSKFSLKASLTHDVAFYIILPPILFQGGMQLHLEHLKKDSWLISLLAIPGVIISAALIGYPLAFFWHIPLLQALLFGALISPTDPVSVLAILKKIKAPDRLRTILEAESLFNDGTGVVLFMVIAAMIDQNQPLNAPHALVQFFIVAGGGALIGGILGYLARQVMKLIEDHLLEVTVTIVLTFGTPLAAEALHCSGIIAVVVAGLVMGKGRFSCMRAKTRETIETFWEVVDFIMNSLVFLIIGLQLQVIGSDHLMQFKEPLVIGIVVVLVSRLIVIYPSLYIHNKLSQNPVPWSWNHILFWGGLRGTIPIILALQLPESEYRPLFLTATFGIVLFSLLIQGLTIEPLLKKLGLQKN